MRTSWIAVAAAVAGCLTGLGLTYLEVASVEDRFEASYVENVSDTQPEDNSQKGRAVVVGDQGFDFGTLEQDQSGTCTFKLRNESVMPLKVGLEGVSCGLCIQTELSDAEVPPGDEFEFDVNYTTHKDGPEFSEYAEVRTSDPKNPVIRFTITGYVTKMIRFSKREIVLGNISAGEDASANFRIFGFSDQPIEIVHHEFSDTQSAKFFQLELTPLELDDFKRESPRAKSAVQAKLSFTRGKPLGPLNQTLVITAKFGDETINGELTIRGTIVSDIMLIGGSDFISGQNLVKMRSIQSEVGHSTTLRIRVRGPFRDEVKLSVGEIDPADILKATLGEPTVVGKGYLYPLRIEVPPGAPSINRLGSQQGKVARVNIETTHPSAKQVPVYVSFAVD